MSNDLVRRLRGWAEGGPIDIGPTSSVFTDAADRIVELETELVNVNDLRLQIADLETANQQLHHDLTASREIVALLQQDR